jgi:hypothetical protein
MPIICIPALVFSIISLVMVVVLYVLIYTRTIPNSSNDKTPVVVQPSFLVVKTATTNKEKDIEFGSLPTHIDGTILAAGDNVLIKNQTDQSLNGIYTVAMKQSQGPLELERLQVDEGVVVMIVNGQDNSNRYFIGLKNNTKTGTKHIDPTLNFKQIFSYD